ncbi:MAG: hypothetical protein KGL53_15165, partial [Elusimicrobia bacterium]|nr:hypothetical protein [Elusimicrobiota bacterium]
AGKELGEVEDRLLGDVLSCRNAALPGGCGRTPGCSACAIRSHVEDTYATGTPHERVPAVLHRAGGDVPLVVSTRRVKEGVPLRVETAGRYFEADGPR